MEQEKTNCTGIVTGKITDMVVWGSEITTRYVKNELSLTYRIVLDNKQKVEIYSSYYLNIKKLDTIEASGWLCGDGKLRAQKIKLIKKYLPPQRRIWDFEK